MTCFYFYITLLLLMININEQNKGQDKTPIIKTHIPAESWDEQSFVAEVSGILSYFCTLIIFFQSRVVVFTIFFIQLECSMMLAR